MRLTEEEKIGNVEIETTSEWGDEVVPLPHCVSAHAMEKEERRFGGFVGFGNPAVHDGGVAEIGGG